MKIYNWDSKKSLWLKENRGISFEDLIIYIENDCVLDDTLHPNQQKYPGQRIMVVKIDEYVYLIPYVENNDEIFLKTIIPSRKATKKYTGILYD